MIYLLAYDISWRVVCVCLKSICIFLSGVLCKCQFKLVVLSSVSLLIFHLVLLIIENEVLKSSTAVFSISPFSYFNFYFILGLCWHVHVFYNRYVFLMN